jgi:CBS domain-containing protein
MSARHIPADDFDRDDEGAGSRAFVSAPARRTLVSEAMSPAITVRKNATVEDVARLLDERKQNGVAVVDEEGKLEGVVTRADLLARLRRDAGIAAATEPDLIGALPTVLLRATAGEVLTRAPATCFETATIAEAAAIIASRKVHQLPVLSRKGALVGMVTALDLARAIARS